MVNLVLKRKYSADEAAEVSTSRESDQSGEEKSEEEKSEEESEFSSADSETEEMLLSGEDITLDQELDYVGSDPNWEPDTSLQTGKGPQIATQQATSTSSGEEDPHLPTPQRLAAKERRRRGRGRGRGGSSSTSRQPGTSEETSDERWNDVGDPDITPPQPTFRPARTPGPQLILTAEYTPVQLFQLFFTSSVLQTILNNTNEHGSACCSTPSSPWVDFTLNDMFLFMSMIVYMGIVKCPSFTDYWRKGKLYRLPFPRQLISGKRFNLICRSLHLSSAADDAANEQRRNTAAFDRLSKIKPLYEEIRDACMRNYHPGQDISVDERMVASKARTRLKQYMKNKPVRWGYKLFVLADSSNGYTWDFFIFEGKYKDSRGKGISYGSVMDLVNTKVLGTGYKLFVKNFYTSPTLFRDLLQMKIWACGTIRTNRVGFPKTKVNSLDAKSPRGSIRWMRKDSLLFVQWRDSRDVSLCSSLHTAHGEDTVKRRMKDASGQWVLKDVLVPPVVKEYNRCMGGVDLSDALIGYYKVLHKTQRWYKTFFYHFMDLAIVNAFIIHKDIARSKGEAPLTQRAFRETLAEELAGLGSQRTVAHAPSPTPHTAHHKPVHISGSSSAGRLKCRHCHAKTPVKCSSCDVPLCFIPTRDCYNGWHHANGM